VSCIVAALREALLQKPFDPDHRASGLDRDGFLAAIGASLAEDGVESVATALRTV
jgi:hypothetical protein